MSGVSVTRGAEAAGGGVGKNSGRRARVSVMTRLDGGHLAAGQRREHRERPAGGAARDRAPRSVKMADRRRRLGAADVNHGGEERRWSGYTSITEGRAGWQII
ncbi:JM27 [macacine gammaherpesvirus 11]|uniref:JM27 n=2 Tax=macacine gammaherpesvirus 11 TaxID=2560570 RepID=G9JM35_9GAMA|nr:JM27 [Macaca fuscata rhadinovirus]AAT00004.1 JM27 [Macaca fuscata rhadinovirus]AEW87552.1 JM27 [Macaca fuscata rhadinovirus]AEW87722.1 JM27 [Macaca fuscata rhadinovirus]